MLNRCGLEFRRWPEIFRQRFAVRRYVSERPSRISGRLAQGGSALTADDRRLLKDGKVEVQIWLEDASVEVRRALKALGFELIGEPTVAKILLGRIPAEKLDELAEMTSVRYLGPLGR